MQDLIRDEHVFPLGRVTRAEVELDIHSGTLRLRGGANEFCEAVFEYSHDLLRPLSEFRQDDDEARLIITQPRIDAINEPVANRWDLGFCGVPEIELAIASRSGSVSLDLDDVKASNLEVKSRSGAVDLSMAGSYPHLDEIILDSSSGSVDAALTGEFPALSELEIDVKSGQTRVAVTGSCPELRRIAISSKSGSVDLDLNGTFGRDDLGVRVDAVSGNVTVAIPEGVGASMQASVVSGTVQAGGFSSGTGRLVNKAFGNTTATLWLNLRVTSGSIRVVTV